MTTAKPRKVETSSDLGESGKARIETPAEKPMSGFSFFEAPVTRMIGWPVEFWLRTQTGILKAAEPVATGWIERRREAATAALNTFEKLANCSDLQEAATIQRDWFEGSMRRLDTDLHAFADQAVAFSQEAMAATRYAAQTSSEVVSMAMKSTSQAAAQTTQRSEAVLQQATEQAA